MSVLVIGGTGAVGSLVVRELIEVRGERPVLYDLRPDFTLLSDLRDRFEFEPGDISYPTRLADVVRRHKVDRIATLAALLVRTEREQPVLSFTVNAVGTQNVLEVARFMDVKRVVYNSSKAAVGVVPAEYMAPHWKPVDEDQGRWPTSLYGVGKVASEGLIDFYSRNYGLAAVALRYPLLFGPGKLERHSTSILSVLVENAMAGQETILPKGSEWEDEILYNGDVAHAIVLALFADRLPRPLYHIGLGRTHTLADFVEAIREFYPDFHPTIGPGDWATGNFKENEFMLDDSRAREDLGYEPRFPLQKAVADYIRLMKRLGIKPTPTPPGS